MVRTSQTQLAVLGALSVEPMTGYRLRTEIVDTLGHFWHESFGQIYPTLAALEAAGLVERDQRSAASGNLFRLTPAGLQRLRELLVEPYRQPPPRNPLLLRLFFGAHVEPDVIRGWLTEALAEAEQACAQYDELRRQVESEADVDDGDDGGRFRLMTVVAGRHSARARVEWAHEALQILDGDRGEEPGDASR